LLTWLHLPSQISGPAVRMDPDLADEVSALRLGEDDWYKVIGGGGEGAVIISQMDAPLLANRVLNLVPVDDVETRSRPSPAIPKPSAYGPRA